MQDFEAVGDGRLGLLAGSVRVRVSMHAASRIILAEGFGMYVDASDSVYMLCIWPARSREAFLVCLRA